MKHIEGEWKEDINREDSKEIWDSAQFDAYVKGQMEEDEMDPDPELWQQIKSNIPPNLLLKIYLNFLSKAAIVLIFGLVSITIFNHTSSVQYFSKEEHTETFGPLKQDASKPSVSTPAKMPERSVDKGILNRKKRVLEHDTKAVLNAILADNDEFAAKIDLDKIKKALEPIQALPVATAQANIEQDMIISVPLRVVEEDEIDQLLDSYKQNNQE